MVSQTVQIVSPSPTVVNQNCPEELIQNTGEILDDRARSGRKFRWEEKKLSSEKIPVALETLGHTKKALRCSDCGTVLIFKECGNGHKRLSRANFCRERICPMCQWRRSLKLTIQISHMLIRVALENPGYRFLFLTLTQKNISGEELRGEIKKILSGFRKLTKRKEFGLVAGYLRTLEVTYNSERKDWHPHIHAILCVPPAYFSGKEYVKHERWQELWREILGLEYDPQVRVQAVRRRIVEGVEVPSGRAAAELGKYSVKDKDLVGGSPDETLERVRVLLPALKSHRLVESGGLLKIREEEVERGDLVHVEEGEGEVVHSKTCSICQSPIFEHVYRWISSARRYVG